MFSKHSLFYFLFMKSKATGHFPKIVRDQEKTWLFNPILKKRFVIRPEERVRLKWVEYLIHQTEWKNSRIGFEAPVTLHRDGSTLRADLILYDDKMQPYILVECKSESVPLTPAVAEQAARYNSRVRAPYLVLTNGLKDYWFEHYDGKIKPASPPFQRQGDLGDVYNTEDYWAERGFFSLNSNLQLQSHLKETLKAFWAGQENWQIRFLDFKASFLPFAMNHYYQIAPIDHETKMAVGFLGGMSSGSFLVGILNKKGNNSGVIVVNLDSLWGGKEKSATLYGGARTKWLNAGKILPETFLNFTPATINELPRLLMRFFD